ncbi:MAG: ArnT family glycosyltransferase [bacterium]
MNSVVLSADQDSRREKRLLWAVLALSLVLRLAIACLFSGNTVRADAEGYVVAAQRLIAGKGYAYGEGSGLLVPPLYPTFLAGVFALSGPSLLAARLVQAVLAVATYGLTYVIAKGLFGVRTGLIALFLASFYPALVPWHGFLLTETLYGLTVALSFFFFYRLYRSLTWCDGLLCGISLGLTLLTREVLLLFPLLLAPTLFTKAPWSKAVGLVLVMLIGSGLVLAPWLWRNYEMTGHVVYTSRVSYVFYRIAGRGYLSPRYAAAAADQGDTPSAETLARREKYGDLSENLNPRFIFSHPSTFARRMFNRFVEYWFHPNGLWSLPEVFIVRALYVAVHAVLILLAGSGIGLALASRTWSVLGLIAVLFYITGLNLTTYGPNPRYNLPFLPIVFIFTARGIVEVIERLASANRPEAA